MHYNASWKEKIVVDEVYSEALYQRWTLEKQEFFCHFCQKNHSYPICHY